MANESDHYERQARQAEQDHDAFNVVERAILAAFPDAKITRLHDSVTINVPAGGLSWEEWAKNTLTLHGDATRYGTRAAMLSAIDAIIRRGNDARDAEQPLREFAEDVAQHGMRCDTNPSIGGSIKAEGETELDRQSSLVTGFYRYLKRADEHLRQRAIGVLNIAPFHAEPQSTDDEDESSFNARVEALLRDADKLRDEAQRPATNLLIARLRELDYPSSMEAIRLLGNARKATGVALFHEFELASIVDALWGHFKRDYLMDPFSETGRISFAKPNLSNEPRPVFKKGDRDHADVRELRKAQAKAREDVSQFVHGLQADIRAERQKGVPNGELYESNQHHPNPVHQHKGQWWFWNEAWQDRHGPFDTQEQANAELRLYCMTQLGHHGDIETRLEPTAERRVIERRFQELALAVVAAAAEYDYAPWLEAAGYTRNAERAKFVDCLTEASVNGTVLELSVSDDSIVVVVVWGNDAILRMKIPR